MGTSKEDKLKAKLSKDPGDPLFAEYAEFLRRKQRKEEAYKVCFSGLSANSNAYAGRLVLARLFHDDGYIPFAVRELETLYQQSPENETVRHLLERLSPSFAADFHTPSEQSTDTMIAETEFDLGDLEMLED